MIAARIIKKLGWMTSVPGDLMGFKLEIILDTRDGSGLL